MLRSAVHRLTEKALLAAYSTRMAMPPRRDHHDLFLAEVIAIEQCAPQLRRITIQAPELRGFELVGPDEFVGLLIAPASANGTVVLPDLTEGRPAHALQAIPQEQRPALRWYTFRHLDADAGIATIDFVTHGTDHPGSGFALLARPGDSVGVYTRGATWIPTLSPQLLVADAAAAPALRAVLDALPAEAATQAHVVVTAPDPGYLEAGLEDAASALASMKVILCPTSEAPQEVLSYLSALPRPQLDYAWVCGESGLVKQVRGFLTSTWSLPKKSVTFSGYWRQ